MQTLDVGAIDIFGRIKAPLIVVAVSGKKIFAVGCSIVEHRLGNVRRGSRQLRNCRGRLRLGLLGASANDAADREREDAREKQRHVQSFHVFPPSKWSADYFASLSFCPNIELKSSH